ncbi:MAG: type II toxin-antitoxin system RelE/ParE family toxin [Thermoanaerobaculia bacterium]
MRTSKPIVWAGSALEDLRRFPEKARSRAGYQLRRIQEGLEPGDWKSMPLVGAGVREIRIHTGREHRILYVTKFEEAIYVLHAFEKKTQRTAIADLDLAKRRFSEILQYRQLGRS